MALSKKEFSATDAAPVVLYALRTADSQIAYPIVVSTFGTLVVTNGFAVPLHNVEVIDETDPNNVTVTYKLNGATVGLKTIVVSGSTTTITVT